MKSLSDTRQVTSPVRQGKSTTGSESCVVVSDGGTKRRQRLSKVCYRASKTLYRRCLNLRECWDNTSSAILDEWMKVGRSLRTHQRQTGVSREHGIACTASARKQGKGRLFIKGLIYRVSYVTLYDAKKRRNRKRYFAPRETEGQEKGTGSLSESIVPMNGGESAPGEPLYREGRSLAYGTVLQQHQMYQRQCTRCQQ